LIDHLADLSDLSYLPSFAHPYSIILPEPLIEEYQFEVGDVVELTFDVDGREETTFGMIAPFEDSMVGRSSPEMQARVYGSYFSLGGIQDETSEFDQFDCVGENRAELSTSDDFISYLHSLKRHLDGQIDSGVQMLIGVGILEIVHGERDPNDLISSPYFILEKDRFPRYFANNGPELIDAHKYVGNIDEPDDVYFTYYGEDLQPSQIESLRETILDVKCFKSTWNYSIPGYRAAVGPTTTDPTEEVIRVTEESLHIVEGMERNVQFLEADGAPMTGLTANKIHDAILDANPMFESLVSHTRYSGEADGFPLRRDGDQIFILFDQVTLVLTANGDHLSWVSPTDIDHVETIIEAVNGMIEGQLDVEDYTVQPADVQQPQRIQQDDWTFDTNSLYHDHTDDTPTSILNTIFSHRFFHDSTIHIPWAVLFEMNKHPDEGSATEATNKQGFENMSILSLLDTLDYLGIEVQTPPEKITVDLANGDVADMQVLAYSNQQDATLVTGDESLRELAQLSDTPSVNIAQLDSLSSVVDNGSSLEDIFERIGSELVTRAEIVAEIDELLDTDTAAPIVESGTTSTRDANSYLESWVSNDEVLPYVRSSDGERCYAHSQSITLVPTKAVVEDLPQYLDSSDDFFTDEFLDPVADDILSLANGESPSVTLVVPAEYIVENSVSTSEPGDFSRKLLNISHAENVEYETQPAVHAAASSSLQALLENDLENGEDALLSWDDYVALCLTTALESAYLLLPDSNGETWKFTELLGVDTVTLSQNE
jgi:predicted nuclease of predicted toxin-antitoxin system